MIGDMAAVKPADAAFLMAQLKCVGPPEGTTGPTSYFTTTAHRR